LKKNLAWTWDALQENAFSAVKDATAFTGALAFYDPEKPTLLSTDANSYGMGGTIMQDHDGLFNPAAYMQHLPSNTHSDRVV